MRPTISRVVHYVSHGSPFLADGSQAFGKRCRAAIIADVDPDSPAVTLCVLNPSGIFFHDATPYDDGYDPASLDTGLCHGREYAGGSWHWPAREGTG